MIIYYEDLKDAKLRRKVLEDVSQFLDLQSDDARLECVMKHPYTKFQRVKTKCLSNNWSTSKFGVDFGNLNYDGPTDIFQTNHKTWIDQAITNVNNAMSRRLSLASNNSSLLRYKNKTVKRNIC